MSDVRIGTIVRTAIDNVVKAHCTDDEPFF